MSEEALASWPQSSVELFSANNASILIERAVGAYSGIWPCRNSYRPGLALKIEPCYGLTPRPRPGETHIWHLLHKCCSCGNFNAPEINVLFNKVL
jgi:hypothetical protein